MKAKQLTVYVNDAPGALASIARALADSKVNITGLLGFANEALSPVRLLVDKPAQAKKALRAAGLEPSEEDVLVVTVADKPGTLAQVAEKLAANGINIQSAYASGGGKKVRLVMVVSDIARASRLVR